MADYLSPGEVVRRSGFTLDTLRYYERIGLLDHVERGPGGRRRFAARDLEWLNVVRYLRDTGMPISQLLRYAALTRAGEESVPERLALLVEHEARVTEHIATLKRQREQIRQKIGWYRAAQGNGALPRGHLADLAAHR